jgi:transposase
MGAVGAADPRGVAGWTTAQDRHARGDERHSLFAAHRLPLALSAPQQLSAALDGKYNIFCKFQRDGVWEAIWAELHIALRERMGREASPSAGVLDSQLVKSAEKRAVTTTRWATTPASG